MIHGLNGVEIECSESGYPRWTRIIIEDTGISMRPDELYELIHSLQVIADRIKKLEDIDHQKELGRAFRGK